MATTEQLETWLAEAETAFHELNIGKSVVSVSSSSGKSINYTQADKQGLAQYIASLKRQLGQAGASVMRPMLG